MGDELGLLILREGSYGSDDLDKLRKQHSGFETVDLYETQLKELFEVTQPAKVKDSEEAQAFMHARSEPNRDTRGTWVVYPWLEKLVHILNEDDFFMVRINRNQHLISLDEQRVLQEFSVGIVGLSVGNAIARALHSSACAGKLVLADMDEFSLSNMNRVGFRLEDINQPKLQVLARQIYEADPYAKLQGFSGGLSADNFGQFFGRDKFIVFDEIDDFEVKVLLRKEARDRHVPVVMLTNLGDNVLIDIERYDKQPDTRLFNGLADNVVDEILAGKLSDADKKRYAAQLVGIENVPTAALKSLPDIGSTLVGRPQLYGSVAVSGGLSTYIVRQIALGADSFKSGRYRLSFSEIFGLGKPDLDPGQERRNILESLSGGNG